MTSKLSKTPAPYIPYTMVLPKDFMCPDPRPRPDSMQQTPILEECGHLLRDHFSDRPDVHIGGAGLVYYDRQDMNNRFEPDLHIAFGVDAQSVFQRNGYIIWEVGKPPDFALEVASRTTHKVDTDTKPALYARVGMVEYWRFDPTGGEFYGYPLAGDSLSDGVYRPIPLTGEPDGMVWGYSPTLDLCLCTQGRRLLFYDRKTESYLQNITEAKAERDAEREARLASDVEVERLRAQLRRLQR